MENEPSVNSLIEQINYLKEDNNSNNKNGIIKLFMETINKDSASETEFITAHNTNKYSIENEKSTIQLLLLSPNQLKNLKICKSCSNGTTLYQTNTLSKFIEINSNARVNWYMISFTGRTIRRQKKVTELVKIV